MKKLNISIVFLILSYSFLRGQDIKKDTLFFKNDRNYLKKGQINKKQYYLNETIYEGDFSFKEIGKYKNIASKKEICLKKYIRSTAYYDKNNKTLNGYKLWDFLKNYTIFIVNKNKDETEYLEVQAYYEIE